jgi:hypothetical protein
MMRVKAGNIKLEFDEHFGNFVFYRSGRVAFTMEPGEARDLFRALILFQEKYGEGKNNHGDGKEGVEQSEAASDGNSEV